MSVEADLLLEILAQLKELNKRINDVSVGGYLQTQDAKPTFPVYKLKSQQGEIVYEGI